MTTRELEKMSELKDKLKVIANLILEAKARGESSLLLEREFYQAQKPYRRLWVKAYMDKKLSITKTND